MPNQQTSGNNIVSQTHLLSDISIPRVPDTHTTGALTPAPAASAAETIEATETTGEETPQPAEQSAEEIQPTRTLCAENTPTATTQAAPDHPPVQTVLPIPDPDSVPRTEYDVPHIPHTTLDGSPEGDCPPEVPGEELQSIASDNGADDVTLKLTFADLPASGIFSAEANTDGAENSTATPGEASEEQQEQLTTLLTGLHHYFHARCDAGDLEVLTFCLRHLFTCITRLYDGILPELAACSARRAAQPHEARDLLTAYCTWTQLHLLSGLLARIESLGHLLVSAVLNMLDALDITCLPHLEAQAHPSAKEEGTRTVPGMQQWEEAIEHVRGSLQRWEQEWARRLSFATLFAHMPALRRELARLDASTEQFQARTRVIFGELLPALRELAPDNETAAVLLFDLAQQVDQILLITGSQQEPLLLLLQSHAQPAVA